MAASAQRSPGEAPSARRSEPRVGAATSVSGLAATVFRSARDVAGHTFEIAALESRLAGIALVTMIGLGLGVVVLVLSAWGLLLAAAVRGLMQAGFEPAIAILLVAAANLLVAGALIVITLRLARRLKFSATRRVLQNMRPES